MEVIGIAAVARNGVIGTGEDIPWRIQQDWSHFKRLTMGHTLVMGRRTYDSIGRPLPGRTTIVITRDPRWKVDGTLSVQNVEEALLRAASLGAQRVFVAGGGEIYRAMWDRMDALEITEVAREPAGSVTFPSIESTMWHETARKQHDGFAFVSYRRNDAVTAG